MQAFLIPAIAALVAPAADAGEWRFHANDVLGTRLDMVVASRLESVARRAADAARAEINRLNVLLSWRDPSSELARLNRTDCLVVSAELFELLTHAAHWRAISDGAFDERLGLATRLWREGSVAAARAAIVSARTAEVTLDPFSRMVGRAPGAVLDLDAIAKGYIVDRALAAARIAAPDATGVLISIGGDIAGWREEGAWRIGLPETNVVADNAALDAMVDLSRGAIATSGRGGRDVIVGGQRIGPAMSSKEGEPANGAICATARAARAMDADALATVALVLDPQKAITVADEMADAALRITSADGSVHMSRRWQERSGAAHRIVPVQLAQPSKPAAPMTKPWPIDWRLAIWYQLPERRERERDFREPYMAVWISDVNNKPIRTLFMVGRNPEWQQENFIWWDGYRSKAEGIIDARSEATAPTGRYAFTWEGRDDSDKRVPAGKYRIHIETSRERGAHTHRIMNIEIGAERFQKKMPPLREAGGFTAVFSHYNELLDFSP